MKKLFAAIFPSLYAKLQAWARARRLLAGAQALVDACEGKSLAFAIERVRTSRLFRSSQQPTEIHRLLEQITDQTLLCELGCYQGGTLFLFARAAPPDATLISLDLHHPPERLKAYDLFRKGDQKFEYIAGDSHTPEILERLKSVLNGRLLDFLFIDGDHSLAGVAKDFEMYSPLVKPGGIVAFHDIVPDYRTRYGRDTGTNTGGVPEYWRELSSRYAVRQEFIQDPEQDGFGIGVITMPH